MKPFNTAAASSLLILLSIGMASVALARPLPAPHSGTCSFNGVQEQCVVEWSTDGTLNVTYLSDGKRVYYGTLDGKVRDGNRVYNAAVSNRRSHFIFTTQNGQTIIPAY